MQGATVGVFVTVSFASFDYSFQNIASRMTSPPPPLPRLGQIRSHVDHAVLPQGVALKPLTIE